jgi:hypothetical protein
MNSAYVTSIKPLKDILFTYNKASVRGFDSKLVANTLNELNLAIKARGNTPRIYDDYSISEFE